MSLKRSPDSASFYDQWDTSNKQLINCPRCTYTESSCSYSPWMDTECLRPSATCEKGCICSESWAHRHALQHASWGLILGWMQGCLFSLRREVSALSPYGGTHQSSERWNWAERMSCTTVWAGWKARQIFSSVCCKPEKRIATSLEPSKERRAWLNNQCAETEPCNLSGKGTWRLELLWWCKWRAKWYKFLSPRRCN